MTFGVVAYPGNEEAAAALCGHLGAELIALESREFPDGESYFRLLAPVVGQDVVIACSLERPNSKALGLLFLAATLRDLGAARVILAAPYLAYMRQDKAFLAGECVSVRHFARLLSSSFDGLVTVDPHLHRIHALSEVYTIPTQVVRAAPAIAAWIAKEVTVPIVIGPDAESEQWASEIAADAKCPFVVLQKRRFGDRDVEVSVPDPSRLRGRTPVLVDDIISTARTMIAATEHLRQLGSAAPVCVGVHGIFAGRAYEDLKSAGVARIATCNTVMHPSNAMDLYPTIAENVRQIAQIVGGIA